MPRGQQPGAFAYPTQNPPPSPRRAPQPVNPGNPGLHRGVGRRAAPTPHEPMPNPRRTNSTRRNQVRSRVLAEEHNCWICNQPVDKTLTMTWGEHGPRCKGNGCAGCRPHPMRAEVDEITPVAEGGDPYNRDNCHLAHRDCNRERTQRRRDTTSPNPYPLSDTWGDLFTTLTT